MKLILRTDVDGVGRKGDLVDVSAGYARNFLVPKGLAMKSTPGAEEQAEAMRRTRALRNAEDRSEAEELATRLVPMVFTIGARASDEGTLFGSVSLADILTAVEEQAGAVLAQDDLDGENIKDLGSHQIMVNPHPEVSFPITVEVVAV